MSSQHPRGQSVNLLIGAWPISREAATAQPKFFPYAGGLALMGRVLAAAERSLRQIDHFDYWARRCLIPVRYERPALGVRCSGNGRRQAHSESSRGAKNF